MNPGILLMNRRNTLTRRLKLENKNQTENLELKNSINEMENVLKSIGHKADQMEVITGKFKDGSLEMIQVEEERELS